MHSFVFRFRRTLGALYGLGDASEEPERPRPRTGESAEETTSAPDVVDEREVLRPFRARKR